MSEFKSSYERDKNSTRMSQSERVISSPHTQALFGLVDKFLEPRDLQEAEALCDGVEQQETVSPADRCLQSSHGALLEKIMSR